MLATMIVQGGEQPCLFTKSICDYISMGLDASNPGIEEVPDYTIRDNLKKVKYKLVDQFINSSIYRLQQNYTWQVWPTMVFPILACQQSYFQWVESIAFLECTCINKYCYHY